MTPIKLCESFYIQAAAQTRTALHEAFGGDLPEALYPEIRAITADKPTRNKTFYPTSNLMPSKEGTRGYSSFLYPYPKPILSQHDSESRDAPVYGRVQYVTLAEAAGRKYVSVIPKITDPDAIQKILDGRLLTVSIGSEADWVSCSICGCHVNEDDCGHRRGDPYKKDDGTVEECLWHIGPMNFEELSFVICPSDTDARVLKVNSEIQKVQIDKAEGRDYSDYYLEARKKNFQIAVQEYKKLTESYGDPDDATEDSEELEDLTLGTLYDLPEDDQDFDSLYQGFDGEEKTLTAADRKALHPSTFCGPGRTFPAPDACLIGSTAIPLIDGRIVRIEEIQKLLSVGEDVTVYSYDIANASIKPGKVVWAGLTIQEAETLEVVLDNDIVTCTGNHPFLTGCGEYLAAEDLPVGEEILAFDSEDFGCEALTTHRVVEVRPGPPAPVYDIEVEEYHNFALDAGVFVHNSHARFGLAMLGRSKATNKSAIKTCLQRKLASFKSGESALAILRDPKLLIEFPVFSTTPGNTVILGNTLEESNFPESIKAGMRKRLAYLCKELRAPRPKTIESDYQILGEDVVAPIRIDLNADTYPLLYPLIEALGACTLEQEILMDENKVDVTETPEPQITESTDQKTEESVVETVQVNEELASLQTERAALTEALLQARESAHNHRAETAAVLAMALRKPIARDKDYVALATELAGRKADSLRDMVTDLLAEFIEIPSAAPTPKIESPVLSGLTPREEEREKLAEELAGNITIESGDDSDLVTVTIV